MRSIRLWLSLYGNMGLVNIMKRGPIVMYCPKHKSSRLYRLGFMRPVKSKGVRSGEWKRTDFYFCEKCKIPVRAELNISKIVVEKLTINIKRSEFK